MRAAPNAHHSRRPWRFGLWAPALAATLAGIVLGGCSGGGSGGASPTTGAPASATAAASPTADAAAQATAAAESPAGKIAASLLQASDVPATMTIRPAQVTVLHAGDVPGLQTAGSGALVRAVTADQNQFVTVIAVVPDSGGPTSLLDAVTLDKYLPNLTGNATDAKGAPLTVPGAPPGAVAFSYSGTVSTTTPAHQVQGQILGFTHGNAFILVNAASFTQPAQLPDVGAIASAIAQRLPPS